MKVKLKELGIISTGNTPSKKVPEFYNSNDIGFVKPDIISDSQIDYIDVTQEYLSINARDKARIVGKGAIFVTCIGTIGKVGIVKNEELAFNQQINAIVPNEKVKSKYLAYCLYANKKRLQSIANAPVVPIINKSQFSDFEIDITLDLLKQEKITESLDRINLIISFRKQQLQQLDDLVKARFVEMFGDIHELSKWVKKPWSELVTIQNGRDYKNLLVESGGYPVYGTGGEMARASDYLCPENSIIVGRKGTINNPLLVKEKFWNVDTAFGVIVGNQLHYQYFYNFCRMFDFSTLNKQAVLPSTTKADLLKIQIAVPPIELQNEFATFVEQVDKSKVAVQKALDEAQTLFDSLMQEYFG